MPKTTNNLVFAVVVALLLAGSLSGAAAVLLVPDAFDENDDSIINATNSKSTLWRVLPTSQLGRHAHLTACLSAA
jgi:hypothetical protein